MKNRAVVAFMVAALTSALTWAASPLLTGQPEPWDAESVMGRDPRRTAHNSCTEPCFCTPSMRIRMKEVIFYCRIEAMTGSVLRCGNSIDLRSAVTL